MNPILGYNYRIGYLGGVSIDKSNVMYHTLHNHGSGETLSLSDIYGFVSRQKQMSITAVGNTGSVYTLSKQKAADKNGYFKFLRNKSKVVIYSANGTDFTLDTVVQVAKNKIDMPDLTERQRKELQSDILKATQEALEESEKYGFKYIQGAT